MVRPLQLSAMAARDTHMQLNLKESGCNVIIGLYEGVSPGREPKSRALKYIQQQRLQNRQISS